MQRVNTLLQPIEAENPPIPLVLRVVGKKSAGHLIEGGTATISNSNEVYVCISQLPPELQERIRMAVQNLLRP